jgi:tRNA 2-thiouridine synthesizing protein A
MTEDRELDPEFDLRGLKCPLPALLTKRALSRARPGERVLVIADDPMAAIDVPHMCQQEGYEVVSLARDGVVTRMVLTRPDSAR